MQCLYCGKHLPLLKKLTGGGEFCSDAHKEKYHEEYNRLALTRLLQAQSRPEDIKIDPKRHGRAGLEEQEPAPAPVAKSTVERTTEPAPVVVAHAEPEPAKPKEVREPAARPTATRSTRVQAEEAVAPVHAAGFLPEGNNLLPVESHSSGRELESEFIPPGSDTLPCLPTPPDYSIAAGALATGNPARLGPPPEPRSFQVRPKGCEPQAKEFEPPQVEIAAAQGRPTVAPLEAQPAFVIPVQPWHSKNVERLEIHPPVSFEPLPSEPRAMTSDLVPFAEPQIDAASPEAVIEIIPVLHTNGTGVNGAGRNGAGSYHVEETHAPKIQAEIEEPYDSAPVHAALKLIRISPKRLDLPAIATGTTNLLMVANARLPKQSILPLRPKMAMGTVPIARHDRRQTKAEAAEGAVGVWTPEFTAVETGGLLRKLGGLLRKR
ncbi:MAG TPA: hypothetical protein VKU01_34330 [Bryobacteraceae bacterium]|nr:hypothetical protein [Bryobacteraceae bacterium]